MVCIGLVSNAYPCNPYRCDPSRCLPLDWGAVSAHRWAGARRAVAGGSGRRAKGGGEGWLAPAFAGLEVEESPRVRTKHLLRKPVCAGTAVAAAIAIYVVAGALTSVDQRLSRRADRGWRHHWKSYQQFHGYTATKLIVAELQLLQVGEVAQFRRYRPAQGNGKRIDACRVKQIPAQCSLHIGWVWKAPVAMVMGYSTGFSDRSWYA